MFPSASPSDHGPFSALSRGLLSARAQRPPSSGSPQLPLRQRSLDGRDCETTENRINTTFFGKTEEGKINPAHGDMSPPNIAYYPNSVAGTNGIKIDVTHYAASAFFNSLRGLF